MARSKDLLALGLGVALGLACAAATRQPRPARAPAAGTLGHLLGDGEVAVYGGGLYGGELYGRGDDDSDVFRDLVYGGAFYGMGDGVDPYSGALESWFYRAQAVKDGGAVAGQVTGARGAGGVRDTVVYLAGVRSGKPAHVLGGILEIVGGQLVPRVQVAAPADRGLVFANVDEAPHQLRVTPRGATKAPPFSIDLGPHQEREVRPGIDGILEVRVDEAVGWIVVAPHPYYSVTDADGRYRIDDIPPGDYTLVAWHEPIAGAPIEVKTRIHVSAGRRTLADIRLK